MATDGIDNPSTSGATLNFRTYMTQIGHGFVAFCLLKRAIVWIHPRISDNFFCVQTPRITADGGI